MSHSKSIGIGHGSVASSETDPSVAAPLDQRILDTLRELVETHSSSRAVAEAMGQAHNYVARILRGETKLRLDVLERILETLGLSPDFFFQLVQAPNDTLNVGHLLRFFPADGRGDDPWFDAIAPRIDEIVARIEPTDAESASRQEAIEACEALRFSDRGAAQEQLQEIADALLAEVESDPTAVPATWFEDLATALATWATVQRSKGARSLTVRALRRAYASAERSGSHRARGVVLQRAAYLLRDLAQSRTALLLLDRANDAFLRGGDYLGCARIFVDRAIVNVHLARLDVAVDSYETALRLLPEHETRQRFGALSGLAHCYERFGELRRAHALNDEAYAICGDREDLQLAYVVWNRAKLAVALDYEGAEESFREAMRLLEAYGNPIEVAVCSVDLASLFVRRGENAKLVALADEILTWLPALRGNRNADAILIELVRCAKWGQVTQSLLVESRRRLRRVES